VSTNLKWRPPGSGDELCWEGEEVDTEQSWPNPNTACTWLVWR